MTPVRIHVKHEAPQLLRDLKETCKKKKIIVILVTSGGFPEESQFKGFPQVVMKKMKLILNGELSIEGRVWN